MFSDVIKQNFSNSRGNRFNGEYGTLGVKTVLWLL